MLSLILRQNLLELLCTFLKPLDILTLKAINSEWYGIKDDILDLFKRKVIYNLQSNIREQCQVDPELLMEIVFRHGGVFSGSMLLSSIVESSWKSNDLDIWYSIGETEQDIDSWDCDLKEKSKRRDIVKDYKQFLDIKLDFKDILYIRSSKIQVDTSILELLKPTQTKIQNIYLYEDEMRKYIKENFDLNICCNMLYVDEHGDMKLYIKSLGDIVDRKISFNCFVSSKLERVEKYENRGFSLELTEKLLDDMIEFLNGLGKNRYHRFDYIPEKDRPVAYRRNVLSISELSIHKNILILFEDLVRFYDFTPIYSERSGCEIYIEWCGETEKHSNLFNI